MLFKRRVAGYLQVLKEVTQVTRLVIVGTQHICRHRLAEAAAAADATEALLGVERAVDDSNQHRLVDVFAVSGSLEPCVAYVDVCTHCFILQFDDLLFTIYFTILYFLVIINSQLSTPLLFRSCSRTRHLFYIRFEYQPRMPWHSLGPLSAAGPRLPFRPA